MLNGAYGLDLGMEAVLLHSFPGRREWQWFENPWKLSSVPWLASWRFSQLVLGGVSHSKQ